MKPLISSDELIQLPVGDRRKQHEHISKIYCKPSESRNHIWRHIRNGDLDFAEVRLFENDVPLVDLHTVIEFGIETIPQRRIALPRDMRERLGKKKHDKMRAYLPRNVWNDFMIDKLKVHAGLDVSDIDYINKEDQHIRNGCVSTFNSGVFHGTARVENPELFREAMRSGIMDRKVYGYGMIIAFIKE